MNKYTTRESIFLPLAHSHSLHLHFLPYESIYFLQDDWNPDWQSTKSSKVAYLVERLKDLQECNRKNSHLVESIHSREIVLYAQKSNYTVCACQKSEPTPDGLILPEKVIIFSQFLEHIHVIEQQVTIS